MTENEDDFWKAFAAGEPLAVFVMNLAAGFRPTDWIEL